MRRDEVLPWAATGARLVLGGVLVVAALEVPDPAAAVRAAAAG